MSGNPTPTLAPTPKRRLRRGLTPEQIESLGPLTFGFDIGIASVGWAALSDTRIVDLGVRCFDAAEDPKTGESLGEQWRTQKVARRRLHRRGDRLKALRRLFVHEGLLGKPDSNLLAAPPTQARQINLQTPWALRSRGLDERLEPIDWARVIYHIVKRRGFLSTRKSERMERSAKTATAKEKQGLLAGVAATARMLHVDGERRYRTLGELAFKSDAFYTAKRNKAGAYSRSFDRNLLLDEVKTLFAAQRKLGNAHTSDDFENQVAHLLMYQRPAVTGVAMLKLMARCTLEPDEYRAPRNSYSAERFIWLGKLANLRIVQNGDRRELTDGERALAITMPYENKSGKVTFKQLRNHIGLGDSAQVGFAGLAYGSKRNKKGDAVDPEEATLIQLKSWPAFREALLEANLKESWEKLAVNPAQMDSAAYALSVYQTDDELRPALSALDFSPAEVEALLTIDFKGFIALSSKALGKILPHMELGLRYDEACDRAGYNHAQPQAGSRNHGRLPKFSYEDIRNPVVFRALNQARNVLNALIDVYGSPARVHVELARSLSKSFEERRDIQRDQETYRKSREEAEAMFREHFAGRSPQPRNQDLLKYRLYREQDGKCAYSLAAIDLERIVEPGYCEVDHALPYSRSFDDSMSNKVLALTKENRDKGNRTPFEYLGGENDSPAWHAFEAFVVGNKQYRKAKRDRLLRRNFDDASAEGFRNRNLNDTGWVVRLFANRVRDNLRFAPGRDGQIAEQPVLTPSGGFTSFLRTRWGLHKDRESSDLHHAQDACVIAAATPTLIKRVSDYNRKRETLEILPGGAIVDTTTGEVKKDAKAHFPEPWPHFRDEVLTRLSNDPAKAVALVSSAYDAETLAHLRPVLVSRAVKRRTGGAVHQDTVRSVKPHLGPQTSSKRTRLTDLNLAKLDQIVGAQDARNAGLMHALRSRLEAFGGDGKKAFAPSQPPVHKPRRDGTDGPVIRTVQLKDVQKGGVPVRGGVADQASMWRVDVFEKAGKFYLVPIYQSDRVKGRALPHRAATGNTPRDQWRLIDDSYRFHMSLFPNDLIRLKNRKMDFTGYFAGLDVATAAISILAHDRSSAIGKDGLLRGLGVQQGTELFGKYLVDVLGTKFSAKQFVRDDLA
ncbi:MAG: type II CRISPR RNA-guided endonuclease Cas9 [Burkholderiales bacterium]|nr:type II CRISPR RNA-guided endonuclease Cas9 [Burkholderiales bacterium]